MRTIFAETFYFLALLNPGDLAHSQAVAFTSGNVFRILTMDPDTAIRKLRSLNERVPLPIEESA
jgi:hypothetical protein